MVGVNGGIIGGALRLFAKILLGLFKYFSLAILYAVVGVVLYFATGFNPFSGDLYSILYLVGFGFSVLLSLLIPTYGKSKKDKKGNKSDKDEEAPKSFFQKRKERKERERQEALAQAEERERELREEELKEQQRRLEDLRAERIKEEIAREERLIEEYRRESARSAYNRYEEVVAPYPNSKENNGFRAPYQSVERPVSQEREVYAPKKEETEQPDIYMSALEKDVLIHEYSNRFEVYNLVGGEKIFSKVIYKDE